MACRRLDASIQDGVEEPLVAAAVRLGPQQGKVGGFEQLDAIGRVAGGQGDADTDSDHHLMAAEIERPTDGLDHPLAQQSCVRWPGHAALKDGKLVAAEARDGVILANAQAQPRGDLLKQLVAEGPEGIVHILEAVEVEAQQNKSPAGARL